MGRDSNHHWVLIFFALGFAVGYLIGNGTVSPGELTDAFGIIGETLSGFT